MEETTAVLYLLTVSPSGAIASLSYGASPPDGAEKVAASNLNMSDDAKALGDKDSEVDPRCTHHVAPQGWDNRAHAQSGPKVVGTPEADNWVVLSLKVGL